MIKLLIVDDEIASIKIIKAFLDFEKYDICLIGEAENGVEAMNYIQSANCPDIIITDMNMPLMDGISLLQYLIDCQLSIKTIVISGYYDFPYTHAAIKANVHDYLLKPIDPEKLNAAVKSCAEEIQEAQQVVVGYQAPSIQIDLQTYQAILKQVDALCSMLNHGSETHINRQLQSIREMLREHPQPEKTARLAYKLGSEALLHYCIEGNYPPGQIDSTAYDSDSKALSVDGMIDHLSGLYRTVYKQVQGRKEKASVKTSLEEIHAYIGDSYRKNIRLESIADKFFVNKEYLSTLFHKKYGETISEYIIRLKMEDAKRQLQYSDNTINNIASSLGYTDPCYFNRQFKKYAGVSPGKYQKEHSRRR